jgi:hypothetical protein
MYPLFIDGVSSYHFNFSKQIFVNVIINLLTLDVLFLLINLLFFIIEQKMLLLIQLLDFFSFQRS